MPESAEIAIPTALVESLRSSLHIAVLTGAGISAESGIPTFRQAQTGLWARYDPEELASPAAFRRNPGLVWDWYAWRRGIVTGAVPNQGHLALVSMAARVQRFTLITQNVDGLHQQAGSAQVIELHGNILRNRCSVEGIIISAPPTGNLSPPPCPRCGAHLRPDVVWFGESLPPMALESALIAAESCDLFLTIGTSAIVHPAASLPIAALQRGAPTVEINPAKTPLTAYMDFVIAAPAGLALPALVQRAWPAPA